MYCTFLCISYFLSSPAALDHHVEQQPTESLHHWVRLAHLHLQELSVVSESWMEKGHRVKVRLDHLLVNVILSFH